MRPEPRGEAKGKGKGHHDGGHVASPARRDRHFLFRFHGSVIVVRPQEDNQGVNAKEPVIDDRIDQADRPAIAEPAENAQRHIGHQQPAAHKPGGQVAHSSSDSPAVYPRHSRPA